MDRLRTILLATTAVVALGASTLTADAADVAVKAPLAAPPSPAFTWSKCYLGGHTGYAWSTKTITAEQDIQGTESSAFEVGAKATLDGTIFGAQVGCDVQIASPWVIGVEGSFSGAAMNGFGFATAPNGNGPGVPCCFSWFKVDSF